MEIMEHHQTSPTQPDPPDLLFSMPAELLLSIFSLVGAENFRQDVRRLAVSREWYAYARPILLGELRLCADLFPMLLAMDDSDTLAAAQQLTKRIDVDTKMRKWNPQNAAERNLEKLASKFKTFTALRTLVIRPWGWSYWRMPSRVFCSLATLQQLTSLEMDLEDGYIEDFRPHLCDSLSRLIPTLKRLRCRLPQVCGDLLDGPPGDLEELTLAISHSEGLQFYSTPCLSSGMHHPSQMQAALEERLLQFAASMRSPKIVRLIFTRSDELDFFAFDAIANRNFWLGPVPYPGPFPWDADGTLLPEDWEAGEDEESDSDSDSETLTETSSEVW